MRGTGQREQKIWRPWLDKVGGYTGPGLRKKPGRKKPGEDASGLGESDEGPEDSSGVEGENSTAEDPGEQEQGEQAQNDSSAAGQDPGELETPLSLPPEIEQAREEKQQKEQEQNRHLAPKAFELQGRYLRALAARFARMVSKVAEDSADFPTQGDEEWDIQALVQRKFSGRLISQCRMTREKRKVAVVLDTSPSCVQQAMLFGTIAQIAEALGDCDLYDAPNFAIHSQKLADDWERLPEMATQWHFEKRTVLAFGDFDGIDRICEATQKRGNRIYWFCCEERPQVMEHGRESLVHHFKGHYLPATNITQLMKAMRRVR